MLAMTSTMALLCYSQDTTARNAQDESPCDTEVLKLAVNQPNGYQPRDGRCEGFYERPVATSTPLSLRSFMSAPPKNGVVPSSLMVSWAPSIGQPLQLKVQALKARVYFQVDARARGTDRSFNWPTGSLPPDTLQLSEIGLTASYYDNGRKIYLPTQILNTESDGDGTNYRVVLWPEQGFKEVFVAVSQPRSGAEPIEIQKKRELKKNFYPAGRAIPFSVPVPPNAGRYELIISATLDNNVGVSLVIPFESKGRP